MQYTDSYLIGEIRAGGNRQEHGIRRLYEQFYYLSRQNRQKFNQLDESEVVTAYNSAIISLRKQLITGTFRGESTLSTYLTRIFTNKCIDLIRQNNPAKHRVASLESVSDMEDETPNALHLLVQSDQVERVRYYLQHMGDVCRQILLDSEYYGYSSEEIAQRIGFNSAASVNSKKYTCLQKLRQFLNAAKGE